MIDQEKLDTLNGLLNARGFWEDKPYGIKFYSGNCLRDYLHRRNIAAHIEKIHNFRCTECDQWFSVADMEKANWNQSHIYCPRCGYKFTLSVK